MKYMAVQCSGCGMLQVKEVRKASSATKTWCCAICNQKQSVRRVFTVADSAKVVRKFVQKLNLTMGLAADAETVKSFEGAASDTLEGLSVNYCDQEEEWGEEFGCGRQKNSFKCSKQLMSEEEPVIFQQSFNDDKFLTSLLDSPRHVRKSHSSCENSSPPLPHSAIHGLSAPRNETKAGSFGPTASKDYNNMVLDVSLRLKRVRDSGSDVSAPLYPSLNPSPWPEVPSSALQASQTDYSPKKVKSCHSYVTGAPTSKWSKYLN